MPLVIFRLVLQCRQYRGGLDMTPGLDVSLFVRGGALEIGVRSGQVRSGSQQHYQGCSLGLSSLLSPPLSFSSLSSRVGSPGGAPSPGWGRLLRGAPSWGWGRPGRPWPPAPPAGGSPCWGLACGGGSRPFPLFEVYTQVSCKSLSGVATLAQGLKTLQVLVS